MVHDQFQLKLVHHFLNLLKQTVLNQQNENNDGELLTQWYQLDTNCVPPAYILQNISSILPNFLSKVN